MIITTLTKLTAQTGYVLTDGKQFTHSVLLREGENPENWQEITEEYYHRLQAKMTPREFVLTLMSKGITKQQIETLINSHDQVWPEFNYATEINRANPLLDQFCLQLGLTSQDLDEMFNLV